MALLSLDYKLHCLDFRLNWFHEDFFNLSVYFRSSQKMKLENCRFFQIKKNSIHIYNDVRLDEIQNSQYITAFEPLYTNCTESELISFSYEPCSMSRIVTVKWHEKIFAYQNTWDLS